MIKVKKLYIECDGKRLLDIGFNFTNSLAIVGESGSGKSLTLKAILSLLPKKFITDIDIEAPFELINGKSVGFVPQNAFTSLSQMSKIKKQFWGLDNATATELLESVGLEQSTLNRFPSQLSGGQVQRVVMAIALSSKPKLLLLDEPTTALDEDSKKMVIELVKSLSTKYDFKTIFVTHEIELAKSFCEDMLVIKNGLVVENGKTEDIITNPQTEYSKILLEANFKNRTFRK